MKLQKKKWIWKQSSLLSPQFTFMISRYSQSYSSLQGITQNQHNDQLPVGLLAGLIFITALVTAHYCKDHFHIHWSVLTSFIPPFLLLLLFILIQTEKKNSVRVRKEEEKIITYQDFKIKNWMCSKACRNK